MSDVLLKSIKFPGIPTTYKIPVIDSTISVAGAAADAAAVRALINSSITISSNYGSELPTDDLVEGRIFYKI